MDLVFNFFSPKDVITPMKQPKGNLPLFLSLLPELDVWLFPLMSPSVSREWERGLAASCSCCCWGWVRQEHEGLEMAALKDAGGTAGFPSHEPCAVLDERQSSPWRAGFDFSGVSGAASLKAYAGSKRRFHSMALKAAGSNQAPGGCLCSTHCNEAH